MKKEKAHLHIEIDKELYKKLKMECLSLDITIQKCIEDLIKVKIGK